MERENNVWQQDVLCYLCILREDAHTIPTKPNEIKLNKIRETDDASIGVEWIEAIAYFLSSFNSVFGVSCHCVCAFFPATVSRNQSQHLKNMKYLAF